MSISIRGVTGCRKEMHEMHVRKNAWQGEDEGRAKHLKKIWTIEAFLSPLFPLPLSLSSTASSFLQFPFFPLSPFSFFLSLTLEGKVHSHSMAVAHCKRHFWNSLKGLSLPKFTIFDAEASDEGRSPSPSGMNLGCRPGSVGRKKGAGLSCLGGSTGLLCC